jgi:hypothetical protein
MRVTRAWPLVLVGLGLAVIADARVAHAEAPRACIEAVERGQALRDKVKLMEAKAAFLACASSACPEIIQRDCAQWVADVETRIATVIVTATDSSGRDVVYVPVLVDGVHFVDRLDGIAVPMNPGIHTFRFEPPGGAPLEQTVVIREAEKYQKQHFTLPASPPRRTPISMLAMDVPPPSRPPVGASDRAGFKLGAIVAGPVAGAAGISFGVFAIAGVVDVHHLDGTCSPRCSPSVVDGAHRDLEIADVSHGVGLTALAVATWLYIEWRARPSAPPADAPTHAAADGFVVRF